MTRLAFLVSHPTQFEVPFYQYQHLLYLQRKSNIILDVFYLKTDLVRNIFDNEIGRAPGWDFDAKRGYRHFKVPSCKLDKMKFHWNTLVSNKYRGIIINGYVKNDIWFHIVHSKIKKIPLILRLDSVILYRKNQFKQKTKDLLLPKLFRFFDAFFAVGSLSRQALVHYGVPDEKIFLFPYAVDNDRFSLESRQAGENRLQLRKVWGLPPNAVVFIAVIKFVPREGVLDLLSAFARVRRVEPNAVLLLVGDGPQRQAVEKMMVNEHLTNVVWVGYQPYSQLPILYGISDVFIHPPHEECWGVSVNEAMACGLPLILSDMVGSGADLLDGNGLSYEAGNIEELTDCIANLARNQELRIKMGKRSLEIIEKWSFQNTSSQLEEMMNYLRRQRLRDSAQF